MSKSPSSVTKAVLIASVLTLIVSAVRLYGERHGWDPKFFGPGPGGANITKDAAGVEQKAPGLLGIAFLVPIFGFWFGAVMSRGGNRPKSIGKALGLHLLAAAVFVGSFVAIMQVVKPDTQSLEGVQKMLIMSCAGAGLAALVALFAWPRMWGTQLIYALLARIPVVGITYVACQRGWDTHHVKLGPGNLQIADPMVKAFWLSVPQLTIWPVFTIIVGGFFATLAAAIFKPRSAA